MNEYDIYSAEMRRRRQIVPENEAARRSEYANRLRELLNREKIPQHGRYIHDPRTGEIVHLK